MSTLSPRAAPARESVVTSLPRDGSVLSNAPDRVVVRLASKVVARKTHIAMKGPLGSSELTYEGSGGEPTRELSVAVSDQGRGEYAMTWEIVSTSGDHLGGRVRFAVDPR